MVDWMYDTDNNKIGLSTARLTGPWTVYADEVCSPMLSYCDGLEVPSEFGL